MKIKDLITSSREDHFEIKEDLLYHVNDFKIRLTILKALKADIFKLAYRSHYSEFHQIYQHIAESLYVRKLSNRLRKYIEHCSNCLLYQTRKHKSYEELQLIKIMNVSFHIINMNFVMILSMSLKDYECLLIITNKFFKRLIMISR